MTIEEELDKVGARLRKEILILLGVEKRPKKKRAYRSSKGEQLSEAYSDHKPLKVPEKFKRNKKSKLESIEEEKERLEKEKKEKLKKPRRRKRKTRKREKRKGRRKKEDNQRRKKPKRKRKENS